jgi:serine/threonine-protein kinase
MMQINPSWSFSEAISKISERYRPGGLLSGPQRNRQLEAWGQLVGRRRAIAELEEAIKKSSSISAFSRANGITPKTLNGLKGFFSSLPESREYFHAGKVYGKWRLISRIGVGGNSHVWRARSSSGLAAIKILRRPRGRSLERFRAEIQVLERLRDRPGILPLIESALPSPDSSDAWLTLPIAKSVSETLGDTSEPSAVIRGISSIASTLANLHSEDITHRDLKPENILIWRNQWVLIDFGIASFPGKAALTSGTNKLGPVHYIAPEMLYEPQTADGRCADVYSLAKTLWVLLADQRYPPPGEQRRDVEQVRIGEWVKLRAPEFLDKVFEDCTRYNPAQRISMSELAARLESWIDSD